MIYGFFGSMRSGKTLGAVAWGLFLARYTGQQIYSNIPRIEGRYTYFEQWKDLKNVRDGVIIFDEIDTSIDSRNWGSSDQIHFTHLFKQMGKLGLTLLYTSQRRHMVEKRIRDQTDYVIECQKNWLANKLRQDWYDCQQSEAGKHIRTYTITEPVKFYHLYDSFALIKSQMKENDWKQQRK